MRIALRGNYQKQANFAMSVQDVPRYMCAVKRWREMWTRIVSIILNVPIKEDALSYYHKDSYD